jgi:hypothetical protein
VSTPAEALTAVLDRVVGHWSARSRRLFVARLAPHFECDVIGVERMARYLDIALRRGWFDTAVGAARWGLFTELLAVAGAELADVSPACAVNLFNVAAVADLGADLSLEALPWSGICRTPLDAEGLGLLLGHMGLLAGGRHGRCSSILRVSNGVSVHPRGSRWLGLDWGAHGLRLVHAVEPFGERSWDGVTEVGVERGELVAWSRPLGLVSKLVADEFPDEAVAGEPSELARPVAAVRTSLLRGLFAWQEFSVGLSRDGAVLLVSVRS